jgi:hypothetical protein
MLAKRKKLALRTITPTIKKTMKRKRKIAKRR